MAERYKNCPKCGRAMGPTSTLCGPCNREPPEPTPEEIAEIEQRKREIRLNNVMECLFGVTVPPEREEDNPWLE